MIYLAEWHLEGHAYMTQSFTFSASLACTRQEHDKELRRTCLAKMRQTVYPGYILDSVVLDDIHYYESAEGGETVALWCYPKIDRRAYERRLQQP